MSKKIIIKIVEIVFGIGFVYTGFSSLLRRDFSGFAIGVILGLILLVLAFAPKIKAMFMKRKWNAQERTETPQTNLARAKEASAGQNQAVAFQRYSPEKAPSRSREKYDVMIPDYLDGAPRNYLYHVSFDLQNRAVAEKMQADKNWKIDVKDEAGKIIFSYGGQTLGFLSTRADMMRDWLQRGDPYLCYLEKVTDDESVAVIAFYRDKRKGQEWREQEVVALTNFSNEEAQSEIELLHEGDELEVNAPSDEDEDCFVTCDRSEIGKLPKRIVKRMIDAEPWGIFYERGEESDETGKIKPFVRIFW